MREIICLYEIFAKIVVNVTASSEQAEDLEWVSNRFKHKLFVHLLNSFHLVDFVYFRGKKHQDLHWKLFKCIDSNMTGKNSSGRRKPSQSIQNQTF